MDSLDIKIIRELFRGESFGLLISPRTSLRSMGGKLKVDKEVVRRRVGALRRTGFLKGWVTIANPRILGLGQTTLLFDLDSSGARESMVRLAKRLPGVALIISLVGNSLALVVVHGTDPDWKETTDRLQDCVGVLRRTSYENPFPECKMVLRKSDWMMIKSLQLDPSKTFDDLSQELRLSSRTVKRRLAAMVSARALGVVPMFDVKAIDGTMVNFFVEYQSKANRMEVAEKAMYRFDENWYRADLSDQDHALFNLIVRNATQAKEISDWAGAQDGISSFRVDLVEDRIEMWSDLVPKVTLD